MIGHHTCFRENGDLRPWRGSAAKKKPPFFNAHEQMTRKIMLKLQTDQIIPAKQISVKRSDPLTIH